MTEMIAALTKVTGSFERAVIDSATVLNIRGRVLPSTLENETWHHFAFVRGTTAVDLYVDGQLIPVAEQVGTIGPMTMDDL